MRIDHHTRISGFELSKELWQDVCPRCMGGNYVYISTGKILKLMEPLPSEKLVILDL